MNNNDGRMDFYTPGPSLDYGLFYFTGISIYV